MINKSDIEKLAHLSRLELSEDEKAKFQKDIGSILNYVEQIQKTPSLDVGEKTGAVRNVLREDVNPIESGKHTEDIVREFPSRDGNYLKVKKIL